MLAFPSDYIKDKILDKIFGDTDFTSPSDLYLALYTEDPGADNSGAELTGGNYTRQSLSFDAATDGTVRSNSGVSFTDLPQAVISHYGVLDASSGGNLICFGELPAPISTNAGDEVSLDAGAIDFSFTGS